jgi:hypothetical protein
MQMKMLKDVTVAEAARVGLYGDGRPGFLSLVQAALRVGKYRGYAEEEIRDMTLEEVFGRAEDDEEEDK